MAEIGDLSDELYQCLRIWLRQRPLLYPRRVRIEFPNGFEPEHLRCYDTAREVRALTGWPIVAGIAFLDKAGKLYPWPHMVNLQGDKLTDILVDASPIQQEQRLGFVPVRLDETEAWNRITSAYLSFGVETQFAQRWGDPNADALTDEFHANLVSKAEAVAWGLECYKIPPSIPSLP